MATWHHTTLRVKDPKISVPFYEKHFGMKLVHEYRLPNTKTTTIHVLERPKDNQTLPDPNSEASLKYITNNDKTSCLILKHKSGSESDSSYAVNNGNVEPNRGFGHIAFNCDDVSASCETLEKNGVKFQKKPNEGRMKGLAFALDPDGYWIEICSRGKERFPEEFNLSQTMIRIKDPKPALEFYTSVLGLRLVRSMHMSDFSNYFLANPSDVPADAPDPESPSAGDVVHGIWRPVLELTHNHGTEKDEAFHYHNGNTDPKGFVHLGFLVDDLEVIKGKAKDANVKILDTPHFNVPGSTSISDPDGYRILFLQKNTEL